MRFPRLRFGGFGYVSRGSSCCAAVLSGGILGLIFWTGAF